MIQVPEPVIKFCHRVSESTTFHNVVLGVIVLTAALMGLETNQGLVAEYSAELTMVNALIQIFFMTELSIRLIAHAPGVHRFFRDGWNVFDFLVVALSLLPASGTFAMVARLARLMRVARLLSALPELRLLVATMLRSIPSMGSIFLLLGLILYIYGVTGVHLFRDVDHENWGSLGAAFMTLFQVLTLEGWVELMGQSMLATPWAWVYYVSFIVIAVFVVVNLFIAVVINNLEAAKHAHRMATEQHNPALATVREMKEKIAALERQLEGS
ncbi:MAG: ion transporter [Alphaproteobacteria bacterium]|nr:ion transporter [Alphaproteobacteria bacterium]